METKFELFNHPKFGEIRVVLKNGNPFDPWFSAMDACHALELENVSQALTRLDEDELTSFKMMSGGQRREMKFVNEPGLYRLIFSSRKKEAREFQRWVYHEVLPALRKHGYYSLDANPAPVVAKPTVEVPDLARVYLLELSDGNVVLSKVGHSKNIRTRVAQIERETGLSVVDMYFTPYMPREDARFIEWASQKKLSPWRVKGEFFSVDFDKARETVEYFIKLNFAKLPSGNE